MTAGRGRRRAAALLAAAGVAATVPASAIANAGGGGSIHLRLSQRVIPPRTIYKVTVSGRTPAGASHVSAFISLTPLGAKCTSVYSRAADGDPSPTQTLAAGRFSFFFRYETAAIKKGYYIGRHQFCAYLTFTTATRTVALHARANVTFSS